MKGNYLNSEYDLMANGIRSLTGVPVFDYYSAEFAEDDRDMDAMWDVLLDADERGYIMGAATAGVEGNMMINGCGIAMAHSYSIITAFDMTDLNGHTHRCLLMRNPWGNNGYSWRWSAYDLKWTDDMVE